MKRLTKVCGISLILIGGAGSLVASTMVDAWWYALIPALIGLLLILCGRAAPAGWTGRGLAIMIAIVGVVGSFMPSGLNFSTLGSVAYVSSIFRLLTILVCIGFIVALIRRGSSD